MGEDVLFPAEGGEIFALIDLRGFLLGLALVVKKTEKEIEPDQRRDAEKNDPPKILKEKFV